MPNGTVHRVDTTGRECFKFNFNIDLTVWLVTTFLFCLLVFLLSYIYFSIGCRKFCGMWCPCLKKTRSRRAPPTPNPYIYDDDDFEGPVFRTTRTQSFV
ncbi:MAG: hypothetical protein [Psittacine adenovirus 12]